MLERSGRYGVEPGRLVPLNEEELARPPGTVDAYLIDEIGKIECLLPAVPGDHGEAAW